MAAARRRVDQARAALLMAAQYMGELARSGRSEPFGANGEYCQPRTYWGGVVPTPTATQAPPRMEVGLMCEQVAVGDGDQAVAEAVEPELPAARA